MNGERLGRELRALGTLAQTLRRTAPARDASAPDFVEVRPGVWRAVRPQRPAAPARTLTDVALEAFGLEGWPWS